MNRIGLGLYLCLAACSKREEPAPPVAKQVEAPSVSARPTPPWRFDPAALQSKLQGAWVMADRGYLGSNEAWEVQGDRVKIWDLERETETLATLTIEAPCQLTVTSKATAGTEAAVSHFVFDGDVLHLGLGDAGVRQGDTIIACMSNGVFMMEKGTCQFFTGMFDRWNAEAATCSLAGNRLKTSESSFHYNGEVTLHGDVLADDALWKNMPTKVASYAEAKATLRR